MNLFELLTQVFEIDVRAIPRTEYAQSSRRPRQLSHYLATVGRVPVGSVGRALVHVALSLMYAASRLARYCAMCVTLMGAQAAERAGEEGMLGCAAQIADPARIT